MKFCKALASGKSEATIQIEVDGRGSTQTVTCGSSSEEANGGCDYFERFVAEIAAHAAVPTVLFIHSDQLSILQRRGLGTFKRTT